MKIDGHEVIFSTGERRYVHGGIFGIRESLDVTGGYDNDFYSPSDYYDDEDQPRLTEEAQIELADYMIDLWMKFKARAIEHQCGE